MSLTFQPLDHFVGTCWEVGSCYIYLLQPCFKYTFWSWTHVICSIILRCSHSINLLHKNSYHKILVVLLQQYYFKPTHNLCIHCVLIELFFSRIIFILNTVRAFQLRYPYHTLKCITYNYNCFLLFLFIFLFSPVRKIAKGDY